MAENPSAQEGDIRDGSSVPGLGRSPGGGHGNPLQYSCLENPMNRGAWWLQSMGLQMSDTTEQLRHSRVDTAAKTPAPPPWDKLRPHRVSISPSVQWRKGLQLPRGTGVWNEMIHAATLIL